STPQLESLEPIELLSMGYPAIGDVAMRPAARSHHPLAAAGRHTPHGRHSSAQDPSPTPVTLPAQTISIGNTRTNFTNQPLAPALVLFDPSLGTLGSVDVSHS